MNTRQFIANQQIKSAFATNCIILNHNLIIFLTRLTEIIELKTYTIKLTISPVI